jgi:uncharacterized protein (DUF1501 family)
MLTRRQLLGATGLSLATLGLPAGIARASTGTDLKFIFVFAQGGWDPTRVFAAEFDNRNVDMEADAQRATAGGITYVDHASRPSVRTFMDAWHARTVVLNGVMVRSIAHEICTMIAMTGTTSGLSPDWPAILADRERGLYTLPHLVLGGPSFPGDLGVAVARTGSNGQLEALLSGTAVDMSDGFSGSLTAPSESLVDRWVARRAAARAMGTHSVVEKALIDDFGTATQHAAALKDLQYVMDFSGGADLVDQAPVAIDALVNGVSRCLTLSTGAAFGWDTHANNDVDQSTLWEGLFSGLGQLMQQLAAAPGTSSASLADETVVIVLSELGRTPLLNAFAGKDHWPYTSAMIVGPRLVGSRVVGAFDDSYYGRPVDMASGEVDESGAVLSAESIGATLLAMADIDPEPYVSGVDPIAGILA